MGRKKWNTQEEIRFISRLGRHSRKKFDRLDLLNKYRNSMPNRMEWDEIFFPAISNHVDSEIRHEAIRLIPNEEKKPDIAASTPGRRYIAKASGGAGLRVLHR